ncbi:MAG: class I SAM-dependent methyltransferase [Planctomycetales bacterium]|nr:class I SAM-dependent methyltransferase [Planctomycetales bacterium]
MSYCALSKRYAILERLTFGATLQSARCACLCEEIEPRRVLVLGDGDGRFLEAAHRIWKKARFWYVDRSQGMLMETQRRVQYRQLTEFHQQDVRELAKLFEPNSFDVIVSHFFLDCFSDSTLKSLIPLIVSQLHCQGVWYVTDFQTCDWRQRFLVWLMYRFFHSFTETEAAKLPNIRNAIQFSGAQLQEIASWRKGLIVAWKITHRC